MDETKLRALERQYKLRVKTGCETCRTRRVKCDETKPECQRCTKSGRKCGGYKHVYRSRDQSPAVAASFRNPSFLVLPQKPSSSSAQASVSRTLSRSLSPEAAENRSFYYFRTHTLPRWTEFFDSDLWSQKILQLSHLEPSIRHGVLALSAMHERFESVTPIFTSQSDDFSFRQYMQAVKHSNDLLTAHLEGHVDVEKVLIACIIFTCYENLAGNYRAANMHLQNGLRIMNQHRRELAARTSSQSEEECIKHVLFRFDLQAMTFSDNSLPYDFSLDDPPECPEIPSIYLRNSSARNDLVGLLRCLLWVAGVVNCNSAALADPGWLQMYHRVLHSFEQYEETFEKYQATLPPSVQGDAKLHAGNTLLKIYVTIARTLVSVCGPDVTEATWDTFIDSFKMVVDLAETLPVLAAPPSPPASCRSSASPTLKPASVVVSGAAGASGTSTPRPKHRPIAPNPATQSPTSGTASHAYLGENSPPQARSKTPCEYTSAPAHKKRPASFSPSFELSPIVPLFITACRCRDPVIRRRAIALLLNCRRREGVWDSFGAGMVALQCVKLEEGLDEVYDLGPDNWLPLGSVRMASEIEVTKRVQDVGVQVDMVERNMRVTYVMNGVELARSFPF